MKKISEIGRKMWLDESLCGSPLNPQLKFYRIYPSSDGECPTSDAPLSVRAYSESERRELVRRVWEAAQELYIYGLDDVEDFIKEQGL